MDFDQSHGAYMGLGVEQGRYILAYFFAALPCFFAHTCIRSPLGAVGALVFFQFRYTQHFTENVCGCFSN